jgi:exopolysaccharide biosynthesis polyprenyl glycosylphosphotransferase
LATPDVDKRPHPVELKASPIHGDVPPAWSELVGRATFKKAVFLMSDLPIIAFSYWIARVTVQRWLHVRPEHIVPAHYYLLYLPAFAVLLYLLNAYRSHDLRRPEKELELVCKGTTLAFLVLVTANFVVFRSGISRYFLVTWYFVSLPLLLAARFTLRGAYIALWKRGWAQQRTLLVGSPEELRGFQEVLFLQRYGGCGIAGVLLPRETLEDGEDLQVPVLGTVDRWQEVASGQRVDLIVIGLASLTHSQEIALEMLPFCREKGIEVEVCSNLFGSPRLQYEMDEFSGFVRFRPKPRWGLNVQLFMKGLLDRVIGLVGSVVVLAMTPLIGLLIKLEDGGPIFYRSAYLGQDGRNHYYLKFRSMCLDADGVLARAPELHKQFRQKFKLEEDPRVTRVGRFLRKYSLDEFPQFFSVLLGKLSFVGPRTIRREESRRYGVLLAKLLTFKPGVTGFWQVMGRQTTNYESRVQMDMFYIDHWSFWLDLFIMAKTVWQTVKAEGAY